MAGADPVSHDGHAARRAGGSASARPIPRVLFLCAGNSCRSQMAEGWARALLSGRIEAHSAGTHPQTLNARAVRAMSECGIDISQHRPKRPEDIGLHFDAIVTVCGSAHDSCPAIPGTCTVHAPFDDPPRLAAYATSEDDAMGHYRRVRDEIRAFVERLPEMLVQSSATPTKGD